MKRTRIRPISKKGQKQIKSDEDTYKEVWDSGFKLCEECGISLGDEFRDDNGKIKKFIFSHILSKGAFPDLRNNPKNFNLLCFKHHQEWEFGDRSKMEIYEKNLVTIELLRSGVFNTEISRNLFDLREKAKAKFSLHRCEKYLSLLVNDLDETEFDLVESLVEQLQTEYVQSDFELLSVEIDKLIGKYKNRLLYG